MSSEHHEELRGFHGIHRGFPWSHVVGLVVSLVLTFAALWLVQAHAMPHGLLLAVILVLAVLQIVVQLFFFMHFLESYGPRYHVTSLALAFVFTVCIIAGSLWIMTFGGEQTY
ncbi:cytochrome o ubiquinol oxidase subunit IV [Alicyclobacillus contaminans]|uniref:cytochrome C oxidase subunit IV family protein n=1 Tax=Alicyclobacillus contaminans TaxID=392016 RepID=UPI00041EB987|nr:cytochrome C oxidase subunit IV family protein [Alicyclobacillus contaminans]GMA51471.1 cytochrome o ubiquinol oxidase subunit IV [Alicyclobacillus contaminans]